MKELKKIIDDKFDKICIDLDRVGAKRISRDTVRKGLDELMVELEASSRRRMINSRMKPKTSRTGLLCAESRTY